MPENIVRQVAETDAKVELIAAMISTNFYLLLTCLTICCETSCTKISVTDCALNNKQNCFCGALPHHNYLIS